MTCIVLLQVATCHMLPPCRALLLAQTPKVMHLPRCARLHAVLAIRLAAAWPLRCGAKVMRCEGRKGQERLVNDVMLMNVHWLMMLEVAMVMQMVV